MNFFLEGYICGALSRVTSKILLSSVPSKLVFSVVLVVLRCRVRFPYFFFLMFPTVLFGAKFFAFKFLLFFNPNSVDVTTDKYLFYFGGEARRYHKGKEFWDFEKISVGSFG